MRTWVQIIVGGITGLFIVIVLVCIINSFPVREPPRVKPAKQEVWTGVIDFETGAIQLVKE